MRPWLYLSGGLVVWTVHFFGIYIAGSIFPDTLLARILTGVLTIACLIADALLLRAAAAGLRVEDEVNRWMNLMAALAAALSFIAVLWQGLPALIG